MASVSPLIGSLTPGSLNPAPGTPAGDLFARLNEAELGVLELMSVVHGHRLGLYASLAADGPASAPALAGRLGLNPRMSREWLEQQAVAGFLEVLSGATPDERVFGLSPAAAEVLVDGDSLSYGVPTALEALHAVKYVDLISDSIRSGAGVARLYEWIDGRPDGNRSKFLKLIGPDWFSALPDVQARLCAGGRVADIGVGSGWSSIAMALAYPAIQVDGFDLDADAIEHAVAHAAAYGVSERVTLLAQDGRAIEFAGRYDLVTVFEAVHDMSRPVEVLGALRRLLADGGSVVIADEKVREDFVAPGTPFDRLVYGWSLASCLPAAMTDPQAVGTGAVMRPATLERYALDAGYSRMEILPIEHFEWRFYRLFP